MARVLVISRDHIGLEMAGSGIRYLELARALTVAHSVVLAAPTGSRSPWADGPETVTYDPGRPGALRRVFDEHQVVFSPPLPPRLLRGVTRNGRIWIADLYNPEQFEGLEHQRAAPRLERRIRDIVRIDRLVFSARVATAFVCAGERQRDMWLGFLAASRRLDSDRYESDPELRSLIDVVPFGLPDSPPLPSARPVLRGPLVPQDARIVVWNGGLWNWLDPLTVIRAIAILREDDPSWALVFAGISRPGPRPPMEMAQRAVALADELGLREAGAAHFRSGWTPYEERAAVLLESDVGVSAHHATLESRFAHRTRILDYLWTGLPIVATEGDEWSERISKDSLGEVVPPEHPNVFADAVRRVVERGRDAYTERLRVAAAEHTWTRAAEPLLGMIETAATSPRRERRLAGTAVRLRHGAAEIARAALPEKRRKVKD
jgi:glycosyltransferase involved in cell wall biosynthesis